MSAVIIVLDTSYLVELAGCDGVSVPAASVRVRAMFDRAGGRGTRFFVPLPCLFELGDHIAHVPHAGRRERLVGWFLQVVAECLTSDDPWTVTPAESPEKVLPDLLARFGPLAVQQKIGLVDTFAASEAERLKAKFGTLKARVHIWTNDGPLKRLEPDKETAAYLWHADGSPR